MSERRLTGLIEFDVTALSDAEAEGEMLIGPGILTPFGTIQAGALVWFADMIATCLILGSEQVEERVESYPEAVTLSAFMFANQPQGSLTARSVWLGRRGRAVRVRTEVRDEEDNLLLELTSTHVPPSGPRAPD